MLRVIREVEPTWVIAENVRGLLSIDNGMVFEDCCSSLEALGYDVQPFVIPACGVGAPHRRDRIWIVAHRTDIGCDRGHEAKRWEEPDRVGWDEPWLEVATRLCGIFNGVSHFLDEIGGLNGEKSITVAGQDLPCLWQGFQQESFQWDIGGLDSVQFKANVFTVLWELFRKSYRQDFLSFESAEVQEAYLRNVWVGSEPGCPPQGWGYNQQYAEEHSNSLSQLSYEIALATKEVISRYGKDRTSRLKALGNAIVPQVVYQILMAIIEIERGKK